MRKSTISGPPIKPYHAEVTPAGSDRFPFTLSASICHWTSNLIRRNIRRWRQAMSLDWTPSSSPFPGDTSTGAQRPPRPGEHSSALLPDFEGLAQRVRAEYLEMPGLNLTRD